MSGKEESASPAKKTGSTPTFTEKEERVMKLAWSCLEGGPPVVNIKKLTQAGGFNTEKTCSNTWGVIKKKLTALSGTEEGSEGKKENGEGNAASKTSKISTPNTTPKKRGKKADGEGDGDDGTDSPKRSRKTPVKKTPVKKESKSEEEDEEDFGKPMKKEDGEGDGTFA